VRSGLITWDHGKLARRLQKNTATGKTGTIDLIDKVYQGE
jgi:hypothetical protein